MCVVGSGSVLMHAEVVFYAHGVAPDVFSAQVERRTSAQRGAIELGRSGVQASLPC